MLQFHPRTIHRTLTSGKYNPDWAPTFGLGSYTKHDGREVGIGSEKAYDLWDDVKEKFFTTPALKPISRQYLDYYDKKRSDDFKKQDDWLQALKGRNSRADRSPLGEETLLLPDRVFGFVLRTRTWSMQSQRLEMQTVLWLTTSSLLLD